MFNGGGAATNAGIDYQQRLSAYFLVQMLLNLDSLTGIGLDGVYPINEVSFETTSCIDDIVVKTDNLSLYFQAKRNINLSDKTESDFYKTVNQFVTQFIATPAENSIYVLATSSGSSSKIKYDLRKILESVRLNEINFKNNPRNKSEEEVYHKLSKCISEAYHCHTGNAISDSVFITILKKTHIAIADVENGMPLEGAILTVLATKSKVNPELFFSAVISLALTLASKRLSINKKGLEAKLGNYLDPNTLDKEKAIAQNFFSIKFENAISSSREILLVKSLSTNFDFMVIDLFRFDD